MVTITIMGFVITLVALFIALYQINEARKSLKDTGKLLLLQTLLLHEASRTQADLSHVWIKFYGAAEAIYRNQTDWQETLSSIREVVKTLGQKE